MWFLLINHLLSPLILVLSIQIALWLILWWKPVRAVVILSKMFFAGLSILDTPFFSETMQFILIMNHRSWPIYLGRCLFVCSPWISCLWWKVIFLLLLICYIFFWIKMNLSQLHRVWICDSAYIQRHKLESPFSRLKLLVSLIFYSSYIIHMGNCMHSKY